MRNPEPKNEEKEWVGGCETPNPKRTGWVRNPATLKTLGGCETLNPKRSGWV